MIVVPVIDVQNGLAVHAVRGERSRYQPVRSSLCNGSDPIVLADAIREKLGLKTLYLADLDAISTGVFDPTLVQALASAGFDCWVDAGVRDAADALDVERAGASRVVAGLETLAGPRALATIAKSVSSEKLTLSIDLRRGVPQFAHRARDEWRATAPDAPALINHARQSGVRRFVLLELAATGTGLGVGWSVPWLRVATTLTPAACWSVGGGCAGWEDLRDLEREGCEAALVATAIHSGLITREMVESLAK